MKANALAAVERTTLVLAVAATAVGGLVWGTRGMAAAGFGAALACANLLATGRLAARAVARARAGSLIEAGRLSAGLSLKMLALFALLWVAVGVLRLPLAPLALGLSVLAISVVLAGLYVARTGGGDV